VTDEHQTLGSLMRSLRKRNGWTLKQMSAESGIPVSTLSKVEHDRLTLTYDKLLQLSQRLGIRLSELFAEPEARDERSITARRSIGRLDRAVRVTTDNYDYYYMCPELRNKRMIPIVTTIGDETVTVITGVIIIETVFGWPGIGALTVDALKIRDVPLIEATIFLLVVMVLTINLIVDLLYTLLSPRVRLGQQS